MSPAPFADQSHQRTSGCEVAPAVLALRQHLEIRRIVVFGISVSMVDVFIRADGSTQDTLSNLTVLKDSRPPSVPGDGVSEKIPRPSPAVRLGPRRHWAPRFQVRLPRNPPRNEAARRSSVGSTPGVAHAFLRFSSVRRRFKSCCAHPISSLGTPPAGQIACKTLHAIPADVALARPTRSSSGRTCPSWRRCGGRAGKRRPTVAPRPRASALLAPNAGAAS